MRFELSEDQQDIKTAAREFLTARVTGECRRQAAGQGRYDDALWSELADLGWPGLAVATEHGGQGFGLVELTLLLEELGYACAPTPFLGTALAALAIERSGTQQQRERWLEALAAGKATGAFGIESTEPQHVADAGADVYVVRDRAGTHARLIEGRHARVQLVDTVDTVRRYGFARPSRHGEALAGDVASASDRALVVVAGELVGVCQGALDLAVEYIKQRKQFGQPIGSFQAVSHLAAHMMQETERARSATYYAAWVADNGTAEDLALAASMAKAAASDAALSVTATALQLHGAIGFTWEADAHWFYSRAIMDARLLGGAAEHRARVARLVAAQRRRTLLQETPVQAVLFGVAARAGAVYGVVQDNYYRFGRRVPGLPELPAFPDLLELAQR